MILLLFGPPGCGKGTQAVYLAERFQIPAISTGEMFRAECKAGTELGKAACSILSRGGLVGDERNGAHEDIYQGEMRLAYHLTDSLQGFGGVQHSIRKESFESRSTKETNIGMGLSVLF